MNFKKLCLKTWKSVKPYIRAVISIGILFIVFFFFRYIGFKGLLGFVIGMGLMSFMFLSKNPILRWAIAFASAEAYVDDIAGNKDDEKGK